MKKSVEKKSSAKWTKWLLVCATTAFFLTLNVAAEKAADKGHKKEDAKKEEGAKPEGAKAEATKAETNSEEAVLSGGIENSKPDGIFPEKETYTREEVNALREVLVKKSTQLNQDIDSEKKYAESLKIQVEDHLSKIESARKEIAEYMNQRDQREEGKLKKLAKFYESMDAEQAAPLVKDVSDEMLIKIFDRMDAKKAGGVLAQLPAQRAARLTQAFPKLKLQADRSADK